MVKYFYDTSALLNLQEKAFEMPFAISTVTLRELENIKTSSTKDEDVKYAARNVTRLLADNQNIWRAYDGGVETETNDLRIVKAAVKAINAQYDYKATYGGGTVAIQIRNAETFVTDDLCLANIAHGYEIPVTTSAEILRPTETYTGYKEIKAADPLMERFHSDLTDNTADCLVNQYVVVRAEKTYYAYRWTGTEYALIHSEPLNSNEFGKVVAYDEYQRMAIDSIVNNMVTAISGPAGSGKSLLALATAFDLIKRGKYDRVVMLVNPARAKGAVNTGFYPGTSEDKLLASFVGNMLRSKFGDNYGVDQLLDQDRLRLICMSDIRGMEVKENEILYIPECQNTTVKLLKLCLSRVCDGAKVIFEGDYTAQVDMNAFMGMKNGMRRAVEVLKGTPLFGYVELRNVWRSELGKYLDQM